MCLHFFALCLFKYYFIINIIYGNCEEPCYDCFNNRSGYIPRSGHKIFTMIVSNFYFSNQLICSNIITIQWWTQSGVWTQSRDIVHGFQFWVSTVCIAAPLDCFLFITRMNVVNNYWVLLSVVIVLGFETKSTKFTEKKFETHQIRVRNKLIIQNLRQIINDS